MQRSTPIQAVVDAIYVEGVEMVNEEREIEIKHTKDEKLKKLLKESMEENIELLKELAKY